VVPAVLVDVVVPVVGAGRVVVAVAQAAELDAAAVHRKAEGRTLLRLVRLLLLLPSRNRLSLWRNLKMTVQHRVDRSF
jgi:hypothetical protein